MNGAEQVLVELVAAELGIAMRDSYIKAKKLATFPVALLQRRPDNEAQMDAMALVFAKAKELCDALDAAYKLGDAMIKRAEAVAATGKEAVSA